MKNKQVIFLSPVLLLSCLNFLYIIWFYVNHRYLPPPFIYDKYDTYMDFFNTLYWSAHDGVYSVWRSVYPPLNFLFLQAYQYLFMDQIPETWDSIEIRRMQASNIYPLLLIYFFCLLASVRISFKHIFKPSSKFIIFLIILLSPAFLFAVERGNLIILSLPILCLFIFSKKQTSRAIALAVLVNIKPYFAIFYIVYLCNVKARKKNADLLFITPIVAFIIFLVTGLILNEEFYLMPLNLLGFVASSTVFSPIDILTFPSSINAFSYVGNLITEFSIPPIIGYLAKILTAVYILKSLILIYLHKIDPEDLVIFSVIAITNYSISTGGYGILYYIPVMAILYRQKDYPLLVVILVGMYIGAWDLVPLYKCGGSEINVYLSEQVVKVDSCLSLGSIIRPIANFAVLILFFKKLEKRYLNAPIQN